MSSYSTPASIQILLNQTKRGLGQIGMRSSAIQNALQPYAGQAAGYYQNAQSAQSALGSGISQSLTQQGAQLGSEIGSQLTAIKAPGASLMQFATGTALTGAAAGATVGALSSADLERLHSQGTAEQIYAAALPHLAELAGEQERRNLFATAQQDLQDLSLQEAQNAYQRQVDEQKFAYQVYQDQLATAQANRQYRYNVAKDKRAAEIAARNAARADKALTAALNKNKDQSAQAWERIRQMTRRQNESEAQFRERQNLAIQRYQESVRSHKRSEQIRQQNADKPSAKGTSVWDKTRASAFSRAQTYAKSKDKRIKSQRIDQATARARLWKEFGTYLVGKGFNRAEVNSMLSNALAAAGY